MNRYHSIHFSCVLCLVSCVFFSGCSTVKKIQHMSQLLTLKHYSESQDQIAEDAQKQNQMFDEMVAEMDQGAFDYTMAKQVYKRFGEPIFSREADYQDRMREQWLYRHVKDFSGDKVYLYFDEQGSLVGSDFIKQTK